MLKVSRYYKLSISISRLLCLFFKIMQLQGSANNDGIIHNEANSISWILLSVCEEELIF